VIHDWLFGTRQVWFRVGDLLRHLATSLCELYQIVVKPVALLLKCLIAMPRRTDLHLIYIVSSLYEPRILAVLERHRKLLQLLRNTEIFMSLVRRDMHETALTEPGRAAFDPLWSECPSRGVR
jgi:hypothetical protein